LESDKRTHFIGQYTTPAFLV
jgi:hypothetical protein